LLEPNTLKIRTATTEDIADIAKCLGELGYPQNDINLLKRTFNEIQSISSMGIIVADIRGHLAGFISYSFKPLLRLNAKSLEIDELHVLSNYRGNGVGAALVDHIKNIAKINSVKRIILSTNRERESYARGFYSKLGFVEVNSAWMRMELTSP
jgi:N-acetylglutamate synthase-like GNAT family acetyltransferase